MTPPPDTRGTVYLVGAGPGDPGMLTVRAKECIEQADALVYDALVAPAIVDLATNAERVYAGKRSGRHVLPQSEIQELLVALARKHRHVVRLKGGDPLVFGRGGEEALFLKGHGIPFEIVPGITAASGVTAAAGIPITHRGLARGVTMLTGHRDADGNLTLTLDDIPRRGTLIFYMGVASLPSILALVRASGRAPETPIAIIESGTCPEERVLSGTLATMEAMAESAAVAPPAMLVVGEVVGLRSQLL